MVRQLHAWVVEEGLTVRQCVKRLNAGPWVTRSGRQQWAPSVVHHVLSDPVYTGTAYANRFEYVAPKKPRCRSPRSGERTSRRPRPPEQWIAIPVPALIDQQAWDSVQDAAGPQCGHVLPPQQEARLPAALPAEVRHLRAGHPRLLLSRAPGSARPALLPLRGHGSPHLGP